MREREGGRERERERESERERERERERDRRETTGYEPLEASNIMPPFSGPALIAKDKRLKQ